jgi:serine/threonine protein kinase
VQCPVCGSDRDDTAWSCPSCGADLGHLPPGTVIADRYEIGALLGRGGMGSVYRAFDRVFEEEVALKVQLAETALGSEAERRFRSEVKLARQVSHPNVCRLHDGGQRGALRWISMELIKGETLATRIHRGPPRGNEAWDLALQAADGLAAVHRAGIVHRDFKPVNLMVDGSGHVRLMDFGIARTATAGEAATGGYAQGSPEYMSPEQARGRTADTRSDVYSLGVVIFELFTGGVPFRAETPVATLLQHLEAPPPLDRLPEDLRPIVDRALAKDPQTRYPDGAAMAAALRQGRDGRPAPGIPRKRRRRSVMALTMAGVAAAVLALLAWPRWWERPNPPGPATRSGSPSQTIPSPSAPPPTPTPPPAADIPAAGSRPEAPAEPVATAADSPIVTAPMSRPIPEPAEPTPEPPPPPEPSVPAASGEETGSGRTPEGRPASKEEEEDGFLLVVAHPWADVSVDGVPRGQTPLGRFPLAPGPHQVLLTHPDYRPYPRRIVLRPGETVRLMVDLRTDGVRRGP